MKRFLLLVLFLVGLGWALTNYQGLAAQGTYSSIVLDFREDVGAAQIESQIEAISQQFTVSPRYNSEFSLADHIFVVKGDQNLLKKLQQSPLSKLTEYIEPNYIYSKYAIPNDPEYGKQWNFRSINAEQAWDETKGKDVTVAVIDTGISPVPDLENTKFAAGYDFVNDQADAQDDNGHGTHVAGTIAQSTNNSFGVAGIAYEATLMPLKVLSAEGGGTVADIAEAIRFAADNGADVINMSLGGGGESSIMKEAIAYAHSKNVVVVAAAGNSGRNAAEYPARYPYVIGVSALDAAGNKTPYSNYGAGIDVSAPGGLITGEDRAGGILQNTVNPMTGESVFEAYQGTSMASPHVAGVAALVKAMGVDNPDEVEDAIKQSAFPVKDDNLNEYGAGKLNAGEAVKVAGRGKFSFKDFFRWLRDNGYLNPRFWFDGGVIALWPKIIMVLGSYLLAWFLKHYFPFAWTWSMSTGLVMGSSGLFFLRGLYLYDAPQWPFRLMGSSIPEMATAVQANGLLNPIFASVLIPLALIALLLGHTQLKWFAVGTTIGVSMCLAVSAVADPALLWLGEGAIARIFLAGNALLCIALARLVLKPEGRTT
ncbi:MAG: S8 family peptidase [Leptolyngbyaceae cyanobacterium bins.302]|nr:S8 family peptidase [Leptolyngbyaceae cyanobacterium bins.302]